MNISGKMNIKHHIDMILIFKEYQTFMILITFFFKKTEFRLCLLRWKERSGEEGPIFSLRKMSELRCLDSTTPRGQRPETIEATAVILMQTVKYGERW